MDAIRGAVTALVESNFAMSKFLELIEVILTAMFGFIGEEV